MTKLLCILLIPIMVISCTNQTTPTSNGNINLTQFELPVDTPSAEPYLFTGENGVVYLSWIEKHNDTNFLKFSTLSNEKWSEPKLIASGNNWFVNWADYPMVAADGNSMLAHFLEKSEKGTYTYDVKLTASSDNGKSWSEPKTLHDDGKKAEHGFVSMKPYNDGYFISWLDGRNAAVEGEGHDGGHHGAMTIRAAMVSKLGIKSDEWELDNRVCDCCQTSTAITKNGPVVVYRDRSEDEVRDISIARLINGQWTSPKPIYRDNWKIKGCPVNGPRADAQGNNLAVAWFSSPDKKSRVNIVFSADGGASFTSPIQVDEGKAIGRVDVIMLNDKNAMVSWMEGSVIRATRVFSDGKKDSSMIIATSSESRSSGFPQMTISRNRIFFAWTDDKEKKIKVTSFLIKDL